MRILTLLAVLCLVCYALLSRVKRDCVHTTSTREPRTHMYFISPVFHFLTKHTFEINVTCSVILFSRAVPKKYDFAFTTNSRWSVWARNSFSCSLFRLYSRHLYILLHISSHFHHFIDHWYDFPVKGATRDPTCTKCLSFPSLWSNVLPLFVVFCARITYRFISSVCWRHSIYPSFMKLERSSSSYKLENSIAWKLYVEHCLSRFHRMDVRQNLG